MKMTGNTVLITGGGSGIGLALARALLERGNEVIVCGRRADRLTAARTSNPGLRVRVADVADARSRADLLAWIRDSFPRTNVLVNNAGIQRLVDLQGGARGRRHLDRPRHSRQLRGPDQLLLEADQPGRHRGAEQVHFMTPGGQGLAHLRGHHAGSAEGRVAGDADSHGLFLPLF